MPDPQARLDGLVAKLRKQDYRITPQRMAVLKVLVTNGGHPSVDQIYDRLKMDFPMTSLATIYRTVTLLKEMGEVLELAFGDNRNHYDGERPYPHPHLVCVRCGKIVDLHTGALDELLQEVARTTEYRIVNHRLDFYGVCPQCQKIEL